jgi:hypothetical protein
MATFVVVVAPGVCFTGGSDMVLAIVGVRWEG